MPIDSIGGIGVFVRNNISCTISDLNMESNDFVYVENVWLELVINDTPFILGAIYRLSNHSVNEFTKALENQLEKISISKKSCFIVRDLNIDLIKFQQDNNTSDFINIMLMLTSNFLPVITMPTRITSKSATLVDHIFFLNSNVKSDPDIFSGNIFSDITDHLPNFFILKYKTKHKTSLQNRPNIRIYSKSNNEKFCSEINQTDWHNKIYQLSDASFAYDVFINELIRVFERCFPLVKLSKEAVKINLGLQRASRNVVGRKIDYIGNG